MSKRNRQRRQQRGRTKQARRPFHLLCKPTGPLCNLRCTHCFYLEKTSLYPDERQWRMPPEVLKHFTRAYIRSQPAGTAQVQFAWQGGEPTLLGVDFFARAVELQGRYGREGMEIANALQTNGTLLDDAWAAFLASRRFLVGLSIDGPRELHDRYRRDAQGKGSFEAAMRGLEAMQRHGVEFNTLTCVQADNAEHPEEVYAFLKSTGSRFLQFIPIVEPGPDGEPTPQSVSARQWGEFMCAVFDLWLKEDVGEIFVQHFDTLLGIVAGYPSALCVHSPACGRALAVEHNGDVYSCDHFVTPAHRLGNVMTDSMAWMVDGEFQSKFGRAKSAGLSRKCQACEHLRLCWGGCPVNRIGRTPAGEPQNDICEGYRRFYTHALPVLQAMSTALRHRRPARDWLQFAGRSACPPPGTTMSWQQDPA